MFSIRVCCVLRISWAFCMCRQQTVVQRLQSKQKQKDHRPWHSMHALTSPSFSICPDVIRLFCMNMFTACWSFKCLRQITLKTSQQQEDTNENSKFTMSFVKSAVFSAHRVNDQSEEEYWNQVQNRNLNFDLKTPLKKWKWNQVRSGYWPCNKWFPKPKDYPRHQFTQIHICQTTTRTTSSHSKHVSNATSTAI